MALALSLAQCIAHGAVNVTVYRITPRNYTGIANLDTADAAGDAFFGLYEKGAPAECKGPNADKSSNILCNNEPILQIPGFNEYIQVQVQWDDRYGDYAECNPVAAPPHAFNCSHHHRSSACWNKNPEHPEWANDFAGICDPSVCSCDVIETHAVGREFPHFGSHVPAGYPAQCANNYYPLENFQVSAPLLLPARGLPRDCTTPPPLSLMHANPPPFPPPARPRSVPFAAIASCRTTTRRRRSRRSRRRRCRTAALRARHRTLRT